MAAEDPPTTQPGTARWWQEGEEPDYRATLANERTFLAWTRTALALLAGSLAVLQLSRVTPTGLRLALVAYLIALGVGTAMLGYYRWRSVQHRMRLRRPLGQAPHQPVIALAVLLLAGLVGAIAVSSH
jgi:putative membrane protein